MQHFVCKPSLKIKEEEKEGKINNTLFPVFRARPLKADRGFLKITTSSEAESKEVHDHQPEIVTCECRLQMFLNYCNVGRLVNVKTSVCFNFLGMLRLT